MSDEYFAGLIKGIGSVFLDENREVEPLDALVHFKLTISQFKEMQKNARNEKSLK